MSREGICCNCRYWHEMVDGCGRGECRRRAPLFYPRHDGGFFTAWPKTEHEEWCGECNSRPPQEKYHDRPIDELDLSVRAYNVLQAMETETIGQLLEMTEEDLLAVRGVGLTTMYSIKLAMKDRGL